MPLSSVVGASSIIQPGVCTSTTRPASPYDGQVIYETDTNLVKAFDGTAFVTVGPATAPGLTVVKAETAFTSSTSIIADNVFTSTFTNYLVIVRCTATTNASLFWALRAAGVTAATNYNFQVLSVSGTTVGAARSTAQTRCAYGAAGTTMSLNAFILSGPSLAEATASIPFPNNQGSSGGIGIEMFTGNHTTATAFDGIELTGGTVTGTFTIYGFGKTV